MEIRCCSVLQKFFYIFPISYTDRQILTQAGDIIINVQRLSTAHGISNTKGDRVNEKIVRCLENGLIPNVDCKNDFVFMVKY